MTVELENELIILEFKQEELLENILELKNDIDQIIAKQNEIVRIKECLRQDLLAEKNKKTIGIKSYSDIKSGFETYEELFHSNTKALNHKREHLGVIQAQFNDITNQITNLRKRLDATTGRLLEFKK